MIETYQAKQEILTQSKDKDSIFATIGEIFADGVTLIFDGQTEATAKHYKVNSSIVFSQGDRVKIIKDSGTYVVEYPVGNPKTDSGGDVAEEANRAKRIVNQYSMDDEQYDILMTYTSTALSVKKNNSSNIMIYPMQAIANQYDSGDVNDMIYFRTTNTYSTNPTFQIRFGKNGSWKTITTT